MNSNTGLEAMERLLGNDESTSSSGPEGLLRTGLVLAELGKLEPAVLFMIEGLIQCPSSATGHSNLGKILHDLGHFEEAILCYEKGRILRKDDPIALNNYGLALAALGRYEEAVLRYDEALSISESSSDAFNNRGISLEKLGRSEDAIKDFQSAILSKPDFFAALENLASLLRRRKRFMEAEQLYHRLTILQPEKVSLYLALAECLGRLQKTAEAISCCETIIKIDRSCSDAYAGLAFLCQEIGEIERAQSLFEIAIELNPNNPSYYRGLALTKRVTPEDKILPQLIGLLEKESSLKKHHQMHLHFALGKALSDCGESDRAFLHLLKGNALRRTEVVYNEEHELERLRQIPKVFTFEFMERLKSYQNESNMPIFILGMPRSGSTLVEQIISTHSKVAAAGEIRALASAVGNQSLSQGKSYPDAILNWKPEDFLNIGDSYLQKLGVHRYDYSGSIQPHHVTDKRLENFQFVGLISSLFPNAKIIHTRRNPIETCLSCFSLLFEEAEFTYDLGELARRYRGYHRLMQYWRSVLPSNAMLDVDYEQLVTNTEPEVRRILSFCQLDWEPSCLQFYKTRRSVRTASAVQVRQPIYEKSIKRWRPNAQFLEALFEALEDL